jgi:glycosyltransferase involved in cell wall biosynthesis
MKREIPESNAIATSEAADPKTLPGVFLMTDSFDTGGSERQFVNLADCLDRKSFRVHLGCIKKTGGFLGGFEDTPQFPLRGSLYGLASWRTRLRLGRYLRRQSIAIAHAFDFYTNLTLIPTARLFGIPIIIGSQRQMGDLLSSVKSQAQLAGLRLCDRVVCNSHAAAARLIEQGIGRGRVVVIENGLPPSAFYRAQPALPRMPGVLRVGMLARMNTPSKNHKLFLQAAARITPRFPEVQFVLVGDGPLRPELEEEAGNLGLGSQVQFLGDRRDISSVLASLDVTVLPSDSESLSNAILESMAAGVPVVASEVGGNPELLREGRGLLVHVGSEQALAQAMERILLDGSLRVQLGEKAKCFAEKNFTIENMRRRHENLYAQLLLEKNWRANSSVSSMPVRSAPEGSSNRTRVAIVAASLRYVGGQSVQADLLIRKWQKDPVIEAHFIPIDPALPKILRWVESIPGLRTVLRQPFYISQLWNGLKKADVAHVFSASYWSFLIAPVPAWLVARWRGKKVLIHYHSGEALDHFRRFPNAPAILARMDELVVPSGFLVDVFREFDLKAKVVPNIVEFSQFSFRKRNPLRPNLVCTRGFHPYYRIDIVVRAFAEVQKEYHEAQLNLVGGGSLEAEIRALVEDLKLSGVRFSGVASREEIAKHYDQADIFINASCIDNMPVSILEAFASGTPVVSTNPEGMRYLLKDGRTGLLCETGNVQGLAENVIRLLQEPELAADLAANAFEQSKQYHWKIVREQWLEVYSSMLDGSERSLSNFPPTVEQNDRNYRN